MRTDKWLSEIEKFARKANHFRVYDLLDLMKTSGIPVSRATVYRAIKKLLSVGKIVQISNERERMFEFVNEQIHYHFKCKNCGEMFEFFSETIDNSIKEGTRKFKILLTGQNLILEGFCRSCCRRKNAKRKRNYNG
ncbi:MAG: transcriptional repressor [bacterium]|nr:transcriptional repressor [bacterium]